MNKNIDVASLKRFFRILKEQHLLKQYLLTLTNYNLYCDFHINSFKVWLKFADEIILKINDKTIHKLISDCLYFCDWREGDEILLKYPNKNFKEWSEFYNFIKNEMNALEKLKPYMR